MISFRRVSLFCLAFLSFRAQTALCVRCVYLALKHSDFIKIYKVLTYLVKCYSPNIQIQTCWVIFRPETSTYLESLALLWIQIQLSRLRKCTTSMYETHFWMRWYSVITGKWSCVSLNLEVKWDQLWGSHTSGADFIWSWGLCCTLSFFVVRVAAIFIYYSCLCSCVWWTCQLPQTLNLVCLFVLL